MQGLLLPALFHWSPSNRYSLILIEGLRPFELPTISTAPQPYVCLSPTPSGAWSLSGATEPFNERDEWDLWQVRLNDNDGVSYRSDFGRWLREVRVHNPISPDRIWWAGRRTCSLRIPNLPSPPPQDTEPSESD